MSDQPARSKYRKLLICPDHGFSPFLWDGESGGVVADGAYYYGPEPMSQALWSEFAEWMRGYSEAVYAEGGTPASWCWEDFHRKGLELADRLREVVGPGCEVIYQRPQEDTGIP